jgi:hypothetical protein
VAAAKVSAASTRLPVMHARLPGQLAFGPGEHVCIGMNLARIAMPGADHNVDVGGSARVVD